MTITRHSPAETMDLVLSALEKEADLDGLVTSSCARIGELAGFTSTHVSNTVHQLEAGGRLSIVGRGGRGPGLRIQLAGYGE